MLFATRTFPMKCHFFALLTPLVAFSAATLSAQVAFNDYQLPPHEYYDLDSQDPVSVLVRKIESGEKSPDYSSQRAFVDWLLAELEIPPASQTIVFSRTGLQRKVVSPHNPRALFFNDETYMTWIPGGMVELASFDPALGPLFFLLQGSEEEKPAKVQFNRRESCLNGCHAGSATNYLPGLLARSLHVDAEGNPTSVDKAGIVVNAISNHENMFHTMPLKERWGGWFVTGGQGKADHIGNLVIPTRGAPAMPAPSLTETKVSYPHGPSSDILPLLIQDHQIGLLNTLYESLYRWRTALHLANEKRAAAGEAPLTQLEHGTIEDLMPKFDKSVKQFLFAGEAPLPDGGVKGDPAFIEAFRASRIEDAKGRSLRDFDLKTRLMKHRCSHMILSPQFQGMPTEFRTLIFGRLRDVLTVRPAPAGFEHLPDDERVALLEILDETVPGFAEKTLAGSSR
jgi:hypothetical protein